MSPADIVTALLQALESGDLDKVSEYLSEGFVFSGPTPRPLDKPRYLEFVRSMREAFPDLAFNAKELREQGRSVLLTLQVTGTQTGDLTIPVPGMPTVPATGRRVSLPQEPARATVQGDRVAAFSVQPVQGGGVLGILHQLGVQLPVRTI